MPHHAQSSWHHLSVLTAGDAVSGPHHEGAGVSAAWRQRHRERQGHWGVSGVRPQTVEGAGPPLH